LQAEIHLVKKYSLSYLELFLNLRFHIRKWTLSVLQYPSW
jgi:hypothetical protein